MRIVWVLAIAVSLVFASGGCDRKKASAKPTGPLVPTAREREVLRAFKLEAESEKGQRKIKEVRVAEERIAEARRSMEELAKLAKERKDREAAEEAN